MKKIKLILVGVLSGLMLVACGDDKSDGNGGGGNGSLTVQSNGRVVDGDGRDVGGCGEMRQGYEVPENQGACESMRNVSRYGSPGYEDPAGNMYTQVGSSYEPMNQGYDSLNCTVGHYPNPPCKPEVVDYQPSNPVYD